MNKRYKMTDVLVIKNANTVPDREATEAQKQWESDGTVNIEYLTRTLGDISQPISISPRDVRPKKENKDKAC